MNVKTYRAATMREALEQVKQELGEQALVLDSKRVRAGGFLGIGAGEQIEIRVAAENHAAPAQNAAAPTQNAAAKSREAAGRGLAQAFARRGKSAYAGLSLTDDGPATPAPAAPRAERLAGPTFAALAARARIEEAKDFAAAATTAADKTQAIAAAGKSEATATAGKFETAGESSRGIEVATTAPRIVHRRSSAPNSAAQSSANLSATASTVEVSADAPAAPRNQLAGEFERLRAELREIKFTLGAYTTRAHGPEFSRAVFSADEFGQDERLYDSPYYEAFMGLAAAGLSPEAARRAVSRTLPAINAGAVMAANNARHETRDAAGVMRDALAGELAARVRFAEDAPLAAPQVIALVGPTGVGKTTTVAKLAARAALRERRRVELITLDTYRIAAVEQLKTYAEIIGAGCHVPRSILELDALVRRFAGEAVVLIDTTGRGPQDLADQLELADYLRACDDIAKCLVLQATTHERDAQITCRKFALYGADRLIVTKLDETTRPAGAINVAADAALPLAYICAGQRVPEDIELATPDAFAGRVLRAASPLAA